VKTHKEAGSGTAKKKKKKKAETGTKGCRLDTKHIDMTQQKQVVLPTLGCSLPLLPTMGRAQHTGHITNSRVHRKGGIEQRGNS
jgi:hypothetical protein